MSNFYEILKQNSNNIDFLTQNINNFALLTDNEIKMLFDDEIISFQFKNSILELCYERINKVSFEIFKDLVLYMDNSKLFISNYINKIGELSYQELTTLIYSGNLNSEILMEITRLNSFNNYLKYEKESNIGTKLQSFILTSKLELNNNNIDEFNNTAKQISELLQNNPNFSVDIEMLFDTYLDKIIKTKNIQVNDNLNNIGLSIMYYYLKNHIKISRNLIIFYVKLRLKELNLETICNDAVISEQDSPIFGYWQDSEKKLVIYINYIEKIFSPEIQANNITDKNDINDLFNLFFQKFLSHEFGHIIRSKELEELEKSGNAYESFKNDPSLYYWFKNGWLKVLLGNEKYHKYHSNFIEENRADLFSIIDTDIQIDTYFKDVFSPIKLQNNCRMNAEKIISFYTEANGNGQNFTTPMQKFDKFMYECCQNEENISLTNNLTNDSSLEEIIKNLLLGDYIPEYLLEEIRKIANGEVVTTNLYKYILSVINNSKNLENEETKRQGK